MELRLEALPDELLLCVCRYLSPLEIFDSFLNLNHRLNKTITFYRENIFLAHLSRTDLPKLLERYLTYLSPHVRCLHVDHRSMLDVGRVFESRFNQIDQQFPRLEKLIFHSIDIETLENLSWRFGTMHNLRQLEINMAHNRLLPIPGQFDQFLCGKLFTDSNSFTSLSVNLDRYSFSLASVHHRSENLRSLTLSIKHLDDLLVLFDHLPNIEQLKITLGDSRPYETDPIEYPFDQLWWKVPHLTNFELKIEHRELTAQNFVLPSRVLFQIVNNLYSLVQVKFHMNIRFSSALQHTTSKELFIETYFPFANGFLWQQALERNDKRTIHFHLYLELDATPLSLVATRLRFAGHSTSDATSKIDQSRWTDANLFSSIDNFRTLLKTTFCNQFWLQRDMQIQCCSSKDHHVTIYTTPLVTSSLSTRIEIIENELAIHPLISHRHLKRLLIQSNALEPGSSVPLKHLFSQFPDLTHLTLDTILLDLPTSPSIGSLRLHSLTVRQQTLVSCCELLQHLPNVRSLTLDFASVVRPFSLSSPPVIPSIARLHVLTTVLHDAALQQLIAGFPKLVEFTATIRSRSNLPLDFSEALSMFDQCQEKWTRLRYMEMTFPIRVEELLWSQCMALSLPVNIQLTRNTSSEVVRLQRWL